MTKKYLFVILGLAVVGGLGVFAYEKLPHATSIVPSATSTAQATSSMPSSSSSPLTAVSTNTPSVATRPACLKENEIADYTLYDGKRKASSTITVHVRDRTSTALLYEFTRLIISAKHYHPVELHRCYTYFATSFNYDVIGQRSLPGYTAELWRTDYKGRGERIALLGENPKGGAAQYYQFYFGTDFRVSPDERYVALIRGYGGRGDYAMVIKNINTHSDALILPVATLLNGTISMADLDFIEAKSGIKAWTNDGHYLWMDFHDGAYVKGWLRVDSTDWSYKTFVAPEGILGGYPINIETGWIPLIPGGWWSGVQQIDAQVLQERRHKGVMASLYLYNILTGKKVLVVSTTDADPNFTVNWLDTNTISYTTPQGEKGTFTIPE